MIIMDDRGCADLLNALEDLDGWPEIEVEKD